MSKAQIKEEIRLRVEDLNAKIRELELLANAHDEQVYVNSIDKTFYPDSWIKDDDYLKRDFSLDGEGAWLSSSDMC